MSISNEILGIVPTDSELKEYQSLSAISEVLGCLMLSPNLITQYSFEQEDFTETLHKIILASISGMQKAGYNIISALDIDDWLSAYPTHHKIFENHRGFEYVESAVKTCSKENFIANYNMVKKWSLLRALKKNGVDVSEFFVPNAISGGNRDLVAMRRKRFEQASTTDILNFYRVRLFALDDRYNGINGRDKLKPGGQGAIDHIEYLKKHHDVGLSYTSKYLTGITYGIRKKRLCISSAGSGTGKTRMALANICYSFSPRYWSPEEQKWMKNPNGTQNRVLYIGTEMELREEIEPILMAYIAGVPQDHITKGEYEPGEEDRLREAAHILEKSHIYLEYMPDYDLASLENIIEKYNAPPYNVDHVFFDYIHTTTNLIAEFQQQSTSKMQIREDQVLANVGLKLKEMTRKYNISIDTATQVSANFQKSDARDETVIRGAKSLADKADICYILSRPTKKELDALNPLINKGGFGDDVGLAPNRCISVYKNRSGTYTNVKIWLYVDMSTMRVKDLFTTDYQNVGTPLPKMQSKINEDGEIEQFSLVAAEADDEMNKVNLTEEDKKMVILGNYSELNEQSSSVSDNIEEVYNDTDTLYNAPIVDPDTGEVLESLEADIEDEYYEEPINSDESLAKIEKEQEQEKDDSIMDGFHRIVNNDDDEFSNFFF